MKFITKILPVLLLPVVLTSCFWNSDTSKNQDTNNGNMMVQPDASNTPEAIKERDRINSLNTLSKDNLATQIEEKDGKKTLKDRRLFVNYMRAQKVNSSKDLIAKLTDIEWFAKDNGVELTDADIYVMIAGSQIENNSWNVCGNFATTKQTLDSKNKYYGYISKLCVPPEAPKPAKK